MNAVPDRKITKDDIQSKLRELQGEVDQRTDAAKAPVLAIAAAYVLGRRKGRRRQTVFEIRRI